MTTEVIESGTQDTAALETAQEVTHSAEAKTDEQTPEGQKQDDKADANKNAPPRWLQRRLDKATAEKYEAIAQAKQLEQRLAALESGRENVSTTDPKEEAKRELKAEAEREAFDRRANQVHAIGIGEFKETFTPALQQLATALDSDYSRLLEIVVDDDPKESAAVLVHLGQNPDEAYEILSMSPRQQAKHLAKLGLKLMQSPTAKANSAPRPVSAIGGGGRPSTPSPYTAKSVEEYIAARRAK